MSYLEKLNYLHLPEHIMHLYNVLFVSMLFFFLQCSLISPFIPIFRTYHLQGLAKHDLSFEVVLDLSRKNELFLPLQVLCTYSVYNITTIESESISCSAMSYSLQPHGLQPTRLLCPLNSPVKILEWVAIPFSRIFSTQ